MKKHEKIEMKIYEFLGIKYFKKLVIGLVDIIILLSTLKEFKTLTLKEKIFKINHIKSNYFIGKINSMEDVKKFKTSLIFNSSIHIFALLNLYIFRNRTLVNLIFWTIINSYCLMLQRYNWIRINDTIRKMTPRYEKQKAKITNELQETEKKLPEHLYKIVDKKDREKEISFEELISNANIEELKKYRASLMDFKLKSEFIKENLYNYTESKIELTTPISKKKTLKLEMVNKKNYKQNNN